MIFISFSIEKITIPCSSVPPLSHLTSYTPYKVKFTLEQAMKAQRGITDIALNLRSR
jgi:hypothetical protein